MADVCEGHPLFAWRVIRYRYKVKAKLTESAYFYHRIDTIDEYTKLNSKR